LVGSDEAEINEEKVSALPGTRAELKNKTKRKMMTEHHHMCCVTAHPSLFMAGYATDLSQQCDFSFVVAFRVHSSVGDEPGTKEEKRSMKKEEKK
jgi:hypothetical protein